MADISISLTLDDSQFQAGLQKVNNSINTFGSTAQKVFNDVAQQISKLQTSFNGLQASINNSTAEMEKFTNSRSGVSDLESGLNSLKNILLSLVGVSFAKSAIDFAVSIEQTARAVGFTVPEFEKFQTAVVAAGGSTRAAAVGIEMFYQKLDQARQGGLQQQVAFERLGISLQDLKNLTDKEIFEKTIAALASMPENAERSRIEVELLSRAFRGIPLKDIADGMIGFGAGIRGVIEDQDALMGATYAGNEAYKKLIMLQQELKLGFLEAFEPMLATFSKFQISVDEVASGFRAIIPVLGAVIAVGMTGWVLGLVGSFGKLIVLIYDTIQSLKALSIAETLAMNATGIGALLNIIAKAVVALVTFFGVQKLMDSALKENVETNRAAAAAQEETTKKTMEASRGQNEVYTAYARLNAAIRENTLNFIENQRRMIAKMAVQDQNIEKSKAEQKAIEAATKVNDDYAKKIDEVNAKLKSARMARPESEESKTVGTLAAQIPILEKARDLQAQRAAAVARQLELDKEVHEINKLFSEEDLKASKELITLQEKIAELTMTSDEKAIESIYKKRDIESEALIKNIEQIKNQKLSQEEINKVLDDMREKYQPIIDKQKELTEKSRDFNVGFEEAFRSYVENATNAATQAKDVFNAVTNNMDSMLSNFVKTGKMNFSDFAKSVIQDLELIALKAAAANVFKAAGASTGFSLAGIASFLGFAEGGVVPNNQPVLVGEKGPEIITGVGGRTVIPNSQLSSVMSGGSGDQYITHNYNINAIDSKSVAQMFYENRLTMFGMTEQARRELPMRNR